MSHRSLLYMLSFICSLAVCGNAQTPRDTRVFSESANMCDTLSGVSVNHEKFARVTFVKGLDENLPWYVVRFGDRVKLPGGSKLLQARFPSVVLDNLAR